MKLEFSRQVFEKY